MHGSAASLQCSMRSNRLGPCSWLDQKLMTSVQRIWLPYVIIQETLLEATFHCQLQFFIVSYALKLTETAWTWHERSCTSWVITKRLSHYPVLRYLSYSVRQMSCPLSSFVHDKSMPCAIKYKELTLKHCRPEKIALNYCQPAKPQSI